MDALSTCRRPLAACAAAALLLSGCVVAPPRHAAPPPPVAQPAPQPTMYFYPELSQDEQRQDRDRYECYRWAVRESGVDPGMTPVRQVPPPRAAVRDGGEVVAGAATGAIVGAAAQESRVQAAEANHARRMAQQQVPMDNFRRAMGACMTGRGYRVG
jgi:hypothetical protein